MPSYHPEPSAARFRLADPAWKDLESRTTPSPFQDLGRGTPGPLLWDWTAGPGPSVASQDVLDSCCAVSVVLDLALGLASVAARTRLDAPRSRRAR